MGKEFRMVKRHPVLVFIPLAFVLSWYPWVLSLIRHSGNGGPNPLGVLLAALIVTGLTYGRAGLKDLLSRIFRVRVGLQWYALVLLLPLVFCLLASGANVLLGAKMSAAGSLQRWPELVDRFIFIFLFIGLGEEPGWRGFLLEQLQKKRSPVVASAILSVVWAFWHLPLMGTEFTLPVIPAFLLSVVAATFIQTWIYNSARQSVFLQMVFHSAVNTIGAGFFFPMFQGNDKIQLWYIYAVLWLALGAYLVFTGRVERSFATVQRTHRNMDAAAA